ncbi:methylmalonyl Co-A mutase-associated GTPase MeaB [Luteibaculum oceani]|uniref:Methylmalonyl Co-A mutase-associated GTPase MeaB n=1 Tax=Luteibaculum oceani TaxID=1294296 RepID=A0A5C6UYJ9_9FLAO|nr:methylmalonyl Co-A mutase-associated GTPase MeaB [Luteibaculum oceani]TXC78553.1 methylmalonyl Co-A mutase-associated GTPase MeaB [Luteibaculum oceani]
MEKRLSAREKAIAKLKKSNSSDLNPSELVKKLVAGDLNTLSTAITLVESKLDKHKKIALEVLDRCIPHAGNAKRIGITGVPGVGKSSFLEAFGMYLVEQYQLKIAVLAIDPSSVSSGGSILGDKTRMEELSMHPNVFIRPSPTSNSLGGVARKTREALLLCEAAGYDVIFIETVGVGQSETTVKNLVDFFLLLMLSGAGDELQGIKRGIMEMADALVITKADGDNKNQALKAARSYKSAMHLLPPHPYNWTPKVDTCSSKEKEGLDRVWNIVSDYFDTATNKEFLQHLRAKQNITWFEQSLDDILKEEILSNGEIKSKYLDYKTQVEKGEKLPHIAAQELVKTILKN